MLVACRNVAEVSTGARPAPAPWGAGRSSVPDLSAPAAGRIGLAEIPGAVGPTLLAPSVACAPVLC